MFNPERYLISMGRNKDGTPRMYLQTAHRILWFRTENPLGQITTDLVQVEPFPVMRATVSTADGIVLATAYGSAQPKAGSVYAGREIEKAETAAVGRALGMAGYGTQFDGDSDDDNLADSSMERPAPEPAPQPSPAAVADKRKEAWRKFAAYWNKEQKLNNAKLCEILGVADLLEYDGNFEDANREVLEWLAGMDEAENAAQS